MKWNLPPLTALRAFEAAARRMSFARAAEELNVTPAAISHQVKALEEWLGVRLFLRHSGSLMLTPAGTGYLKGIAESFEMMGETTKRTALRSVGSTITILTPPTVAARWLVPRLPQCRQLWPDLEIRLTVVTPPIDFTEHNFDLGISFGWELSAALERQTWLRYEVIAACSPRLLEGDTPLRTPQDLRHHQLLHDEALKIHDRLDWRGWLETMGVTDVEAERGFRFSQASLAYQMALEGEGVALVKTALASRELAAGTLVKLFDHAVHTGYEYELVYQPLATSRGIVREFYEWMIQEAAADMTEPV
jgi:LysR family glycine cleavage system transcriptional activator